MYCEVSNIHKEERNTLENNSHIDNHTIASLTTPLRPRNTKFLLKSALKGKNTPEFDMFPNQKRAMKSPLTNNNK